jgi:hypothetical protein
VFAVTLPGTSGTAPSVPACAEEPPPPRVAGLFGGENAPAFTTWDRVIVVFGKDREASRSHAVGVRALCAPAAPGTSMIISIFIHSM